MNSKNIAILFISVLVTITATNVLINFNSKHADYTPPPADFESNQKEYNELIAKAKKAADSEDHEKAFLHYKNALRFYPENQGILNEMGILKLKLQAYRDAEKIYTDLCSKSPDNPLYKVSLAFSLLYQNKFSEARIIVDQAKRMRVNDGRIHLITAAIKADSEDIDAAISDLKKYPVQQAVPAFTKQSFFDKIRADEKFIEYEDSLSPAKENSQ